MRNYACLDRHATELRYDIGMRAGMRNGPQQASTGLQVLFQTTRVRRSTDHALPLL